MISLRPSPLLLGALAAVLAGAPASAQVHTAAPANGTSTLRPGAPFALDLTLAPVAYGEDGPPANEAGCPGVYTLRRPEVNLQVEGAGRTLRLYARSSTDTVLLVRTPDGRWLCNDDSDGTNPALDLTAPGLYHVWLGPFFGGDEPTRVTLYADEGVRATLDPAAAPASGAVALGGGFQPDPYEAPVTVGAEVSLAEAACPGFASAAPTFNLNYDGDGRLPLYVYARTDADDDLTLAVSLPDGSWACNDDADGLNPGLYFERPLAGLYGVWVGSFRSRARTEPAPTATLYLSETEGPEPMDMMDGPFFEGDVYPEGYSGGEDLQRDAQPSGGTLAFAGGSAARLAVRAGGPAPNSVMGYGCTGFLDPAAPTAWVEFSGAGRLAIWAEAEADATLVVGLPDGGWTCNDDYQGLMPAVVLDDAAPGRYPVWVGTFLDGETQAATLHVSGGEPFE